MQHTHATNMEIRGINASEGIVIGKAQFFATGVVYANPIRISSKEIESHLFLFDSGKKTLISDLEALIENQDAETDIDILAAQIQIVKDVEIEQRVKRLIEQDLYASDYAVYESFNVFIELLRDSGSQVFKNRIADLEDVRDRLINILCGRVTDFSLNPDGILIAPTLGPVDLISFADQGLKGLILEKGGVTSHASILAQSSSLPAVIGVGKTSKRIKEGDQLILDGYDGLVIVNPDEQTMQQYQEKKLQVTDEHIEEVGEGDVQAVTKCDVPFTLLANVDFAKELDQARQKGAKGIGLLRTEAFFFANRNARDEQEQITYYQNIVNGISGPVTIRLFDTGGDKLSSKIVQESNPFLGWRGIRVLLEEKKLLLTQLTAILKVAALNPGRIQILIPMITVLDEVIAVKRIIDQIQKDLSEHGNIDEEIRVGIMVEVPSVAMMAYEFAEVVDFFSIGTNDLTQYTLAVDRGNEYIHSLYDQRNPAVWRTIQQVVEGAQQANIPVSICGELAGDPVSAATLMGLGIRSLSMNPARLTKVKSILTSHTIKEMKYLSEQVLIQKTTTDVINLFKDWIG